MIGSYTVRRGGTSHAQKALDALKGDGDADVTGSGFKPIEVKLNPGGA